MSTQSGEKRRSNWHKNWLPKIASNKIQEANQFITNPSAALKQLISRDYEQKTDIPKQDNLNSLDSIINEKKTITEDPDNLSYQVKLISKKMRKYKPTNGSHSMFYAEKLMIQRARSEMIYPLIDPLEIFNPFEKQVKDNRKTKILSDRLSVPKLKHDKSLSALPYIQKLKTIQQKSQLLRDNSKHLLSKADSASILNENNYEKLKNESIRILVGQEKFEFELQTFKYSENRQHKLKRHIKI